MQNFTDIPSSRSLSDSLIEILNNDKTGISCNSGTTFPTTNQQVGMLCYRTDQLKLYLLIGTNPDNWRLIMDLASGIDTQFAAKLNSASYTAADVLAKLLTVDGASTGLDADLLDGQHASAFASSTHNHNTTYLGISAKAADADKLDGYDSSAFVRSVNGAGPDAAGNATVNIDLSSRVAKTGDTMTGNLVMSNNASIRSSRPGDNARDTGFKMADGQDLGEMNRSNQYYDDRASNCNGYVPNGNCNGNAQWTPPNGNWWEWYASIGRGAWENNGAFDGAGGSTYSYNAVSVDFNYDAYYLSADEIGGGEYRRNYRNCNCGAFNCRTNCNCNCNCACSTDSCFLPETMVRMADGSLMQIADIQINDVVMAFGNIKSRVKALWRPNLGDRTLWDIGGHVTTTEDHLLMIEGQKWSCVNPQRYTHRFMKHIYTTAQGKKVFNSAVHPDVISELIIGVALETVKGVNLPVTHITALTGYAAETQLYCLVTDTGNFVLENGVVVDGMWQGDVETLIKSTAAEVTA
jgi:hypothetical protein